MGLRHIRYMVYDDIYNLIDHKVLEAWIEYGHANRQLSRYVEKDHTFRNGPVPGTGGWGNGHYHRRPKTRNELRANCDPDYAEYARPGRWVPSSYDDLPISIRRNKRSWKKNKKRKQWM